MLTSCERPYEIQAQYNWTVQNYQNHHPRSKYGIVFSYDLLLMRENITDAAGVSFMQTMVAFNPLMNTIYRVYHSILLVSLIS